MNKPKNSLNVVYVFSKGNKVYLKKESNDPITCEEWFPINFQWKSLLDFHQK